MTRIMGTLAPNRVPSTPSPLASRPACLVRIITVSLSSTAPPAPQEFACSLRDVVEEQLIPIFHDNGMRQQALSSYVFIVANVILHSWELAAQINHMNQLLPPVLPFLTSHHQSTWFYSAILYIVLSWKARSSMSLAVKLRYILKLLSAAAWVIILPVTYAYTSENPTGLASWLGDGRNQPSLYILAVVVYLAPNMLAATLFLFPVLRRALERSNLKVTTFMMWWSQPRLFVGRGMHEGAFSLFKYTMFWVLLPTKLIVSFYVEIKPLVQLTKDIMKEPIQTFQWHEFFPHANNNIGVVITLWAPIILHKRRPIR